MQPIPTEIQSVLSRFRRWIRRYILLEGLAVLVTAACLLFWITFLVDVVYFRVSSLELPSSFRLLVLLAMVGILISLGVSWVLLRLFRSFRPKDLALVLERKFPQLRDQLITTVEMGADSSSPLQQEMLAETRREAVEKVAQIPLEETFDRRPLKRLAIIATVLFSTLAVFSVASAASVERWVQAYLLAKENYWEPFRQQELSLKVIAQPGEIIKEFDEENVYRHPRGTDLELLVESRDETVAPERVTLQYLVMEGQGTERGRANMNLAGEGRFRHSLSRVVYDHRLWIRGGDFINRLPYKIQVVDPPQINQMSLGVDYPSYTGMDGLEDRPLPVVGTQVSLPMHSSFQLNAISNKPLISVDLRSDRFHLSFGFTGTKGEPRAKPTSLTIRDQEKRIVKTVELAAAAGALLQENGKGFSVPFVITQQAEKLWNTMSDDAELPLPILPDSTLKIFLLDEDDIYSPEPATLTINGIVDEAPVVDTRRTGVGSIVTRNASIPIQGRITDDYGVMDAWFGYRVADQEEITQLPLQTPPQGQKEYQLQAEQDQLVERFDLRPLKLQEGQTLTLAIYAKDGDTFSGPHNSNGEIFSFKIVSNDELLARLFDREVNLRLRFEQIRTELGDLRDLLQDQISKQSDSNINTEDAGSSSFVERSLHQLRKNHTESRAIEVSFRDLREEMVNNGIDTREKLQRIDDGVLAPMAILNGKLFGEADQRYALQRLSLQRGNGFGDALQETSPALDEVIAQVDRILEEMKDRGTINDVIQNLQGLIEKQRMLLKEAEEKRIEENFFFDFDQ